ncbi:serine/threonine protein kinase [Archangium gephyra]|uniref:non-specific serine/threonine protein kinase n=1 Tax=Archangium gephyra TaxID=48 RepID=A0AAC8QH12_9BACT|nr:serine/threonine protein kinase [Archangium gephyra]
MLAVPARPDDLLSCVGLPLSAPHREPGECPTLVRNRGSTSGTLPSAWAAPREDGLIGQRLGTFRVVRQLGRGGMGCVYLAEHALIQKRVAVKVLHAHLAQDAKLVSRFLAEARAASRIQHENVVLVFDLDTLEGRPYLVMEYLEGVTLASFARERLEPEVAVDVLAQVCDALGAAHAQGVIHRDLKPANIFVLPREEGGYRVKLLDFGIAKHLYAQAEDTPTQAGVLLGTPEYMAPEQCGEGPVDARTDLYAAGVLGYHLLTGQLPFSGRTTAEVLLAHLRVTPRPAHELAPRVPAALSRVLQRAMARQPEERYASAAELKTALLAAISPGRSAAPPAFHARLSVKDGEAPRRLGCDQVGRTGLFLRTDAPPPLLTPVRLLLELPGGELPCTGQVVRHVTPAQAEAWGMEPGFGVELQHIPADFHETLTRLLSGTRAPATAPVRDNPEAEHVLRDFRNRAQGDHYALLGLAPDATRERVREAARLARQTLESLLSGALSAEQRTQVERQLERVSQALLVLGNLERRVEYDGARRNAAGIIRCLAEGLTVSQLEEARQRFLARERGADSRSLVHLLSARLHEKSGQNAQALAAYEQAVQADPLHLETLNGYRTLQLKLRGEPRRPSGSWPTRPL